MPPVSHDAGIGVCWRSNASYIGAIAFVLNAVVSIIGWRIYRHEVTDMVGFERQLFPTHCGSDQGDSNHGDADRSGCCRGCCLWWASVDWLGHASIIFLVGATLDTVDEFISYESAQAWVRVVSQRKSNLSH